MDDDLEKNAELLTRQLLVLSEKKAVKHLKSLADANYTLYCLVMDRLQKEGFPFSG